MSWFMLYAASQAAVLENAYLKVVVNDGPFEAGRFSVQTTGGDPARADDDAQELLYGGAEPWSSYTTVRIDGKDYLFGGPTQRRAGLNLPTGEHVTGPVKQGKAIHTVYKIQDLLVTQIISLERTSTTGLEDATQIQYLVSNQGKNAHSFGIRLLLDTKLGREDGAAIRVGERALSTETALSGGSLPDFWQAFDNLAEPHVIAQGTLKGGALMPPDSILIANWGTLADKSWKAPLNSGRGFIREGEDEPDTAFALFWEGTLQAGETKSYCTHYGLGGVTISRGRLSLGVTSPKEVLDNQSFKIIAYIENKEQGTVENAWLKLQLPAGFTTVAPLERKLGQVKGGQSLTAEWLVSAGAMAAKKSSFTVVVGGDHCEPVSVTRQVEIIGPPAISLDFKEPTINIADQRWVLADDPEKKPIWIFPVQVTVKNGGDSAAQVELSGETISGLEFALPYDKYKYIGALGPKQSYQFIWYFAPTSFAGGRGEFKIAANYHNKTEQTTGTFFYPKLPVKLSLEQRKSQLKAHDTFSVEFWAQNLSSLTGYSLLIMYPDFLEPVSVFRGTAIREGSFNWQQEQKGVIRVEAKLNQARDVKKDTLATLNFLAKAAGEGEVQVIPVNPTSGAVIIKLKIEEAEQ